MMKFLEKLKSPKAGKRNVALAVIYMLLMGALLIMSFVWHFSRQ